MLLRIPSRAVQEETEHKDPVFRWRHSFESEAANVEALLEVVQEVVGMSGSRDAEVQGERIDGNSCFSCVHLHDSCEESLREEEG